MSAATVSRNASNAHLLRSLVGWWGLRDAAGTSRVDSTGNNAMAESDGAVGVGDGLGGGNAAQFTGSGGAYLKATGFSSAHLGGAFTIAQWIKPTLLNASMFWICRGTSGATATVSLATTNARIPGFTIGVNSVIGSALSLGEWCHLCGTYDGVSEMRFYIGGSFIGSKVDVSSGTSRAQLNIGATGQQSAVANGLIQGVGVWTRAMSNGEVLSLYNGGLALDYPFNIAG